MKQQKCPFFSFRIAHVVFESTLIFREETPLAVDDFLVIFLYMLLFWCLRIMVRLFEAKKGEQIKI